MRFMDKMELSLTELRNTKEKNDFLLNTINSIIEENGWSLINTKKVSESIIDIGESAKHEFQYTSPFGKLKIKAIFLPSGVGILHDTPDGEKETRYLLRKYVYDVDGKPILINRNALIVNIKQMLEKSKIAKPGWENDESSAKHWPEPKSRDIVLPKKEIIKEKKEEVKKELTPCPFCGEQLELYWKSCPMCRTILK